MPEHAPFPEQKPRPVKALQRCPNCEARADVSFYVAGSLARCSRCGVRFEVLRQGPPQVDVHRRPANAPAAAPALPATRVDRGDPAAPSSLDLALDAAIANAQPEAEIAAVPVAAQAQQAVRPPPANGAPSLPHLDGFVVHERLGQGGMGEVFRCTRLSDGRALAVKVLSASLAAVPDYVRRFDREAAAMAQLSHPGIVKLLDRGRSGPHCWISMELIEGTSLRTHAARNKPSPRQLAKLLAQVAHALAYAHARAVVHRDLKPDNVLVLADGRTKVLDFGLAGLHAEGAEVLTQSNVAMGTANYMAPEQRRDARRADHRADLYSFGVMAYELLTGELPVGRFAAPSKLVPTLDRAWDGLIERCLEAEPSARPHSALELAHALEGLAGLSDPLQLAPRTRRKEPRTRFWSWIGLGAGAALLVGTAALQISRDHERRAAAEVRASHSLHPSSAAQARTALTGRRAPRAR
jgi:serine/threonine-protein kinase